MTAPIILLISHVIPHPPAAGNEIRILKMVTWLKRQGFRIVLLLNHEPLPAARRLELETMVGPVHFIGDDYHTEFPPISWTDHPFVALKRFAARTLPDSRLYRWLFGMEKQKKVHSDAVKRYLASERLIQVARHLCEAYNPFAVIAEYIFAAPCLDVVPSGTMKIIDTHDMFSRKNEQVVSFGIDDPLPCTRREERNYLLKSDLVIAIQSREAQMMRTLVRSRDVITVGIDFDVVGEIDHSRVIPGTILVVGSDNPLNQHGLKVFHERAWPIIRAGHPDAVLRVVGKLANHLQTDDQRVQCVGWVPSLDGEYEKAAVVINPTQAGTGLKIKSVEALCHGKALVGTPNSVEGIDSKGDAPYVVCDDWHAFADRVLVLLRSEDERTRLERLALQFARETFSADHIYEPLGRKLRFALAPAPD
ncbi:MAG: glycosyltransferase family 4 protein [Vicinamibacterales bacterium]